MCIQDKATPSALSTKLNQLMAPEPEDSDVARERERMKAGEGRDDLIRLEGLRKVKCPPPLPHPPKPTHNVLVGF